MGSPILTGQPETPRRAPTTTTTTRSSSSGRGGPRGAGRSAAVRFLVLLVAPPARRWVVAVGRSTHVLLVLEAGPDGAADRRHRADDPGRREVSRAGRRGARLRYPLGVQGQVGQADREVPAAVLPAPGDVVEQRVRTPVAARGGRA